MHYDKLKLEVKFVLRIFYAYNRLEIISIILSDYFTANSRYNILKIGTRSVHVGSLSKLRARHFKLKLYVAKHCDHDKHAAISQVMLKLSMLFRLREQCLVKNQHVKDKRREHCAVSF